MRWSTGLVVFAVATTVTRSSRATTDGGDRLSLVGVAGPRERFAVIVSSGIQEGCPGHRCVVFLVDTARTKTRRLHPRTLTVQREPSLLATYLKLLPPALQKGLRPTREVNPSEAPRLHPVAATDDRRSVDFRLGKDDLLRVDLRTQRRFPAKRSSYDGTCGGWNDTTCSSCREVPDGEGGRRWACAGPGTTAEGEACDCTGVGAVQGLRIRRTITGATTWGPTVTLDPSVIGGELRDASTALDLLEPMSPVKNPRPSVVAYVTASAVVVVGNAAHARMANGRYFPMVAALPRRLGPPVLWSSLTPP